MLRSFLSVVVYGPYFDFVGLNKKFNFDFLELLGGDEQKWLAFLKMLKKSDF